MNSPAEGTVVGIGPVRRNLGALDGIRGMAILLVLMNHFARFLPDSPILVPIKSAFNFGWIGVDLFFVLSGFLITGILLQTKSATNYFGAFYARRILRIFPLYYLVLFVVFGLAGHLPPAAQTAIPLPQDRWLYVVYLTNWLGLWHGTWGPNVVGHFWSLAVEEQFYLVWPLCVFLIPERFIGWTTIGLSVTALIVRMNWVAHTGPSQAIAIATVTRMDALLLGAFAAWLFRRGLAPRVARALVPTAFVALGAFAVTVGVLPAVSAETFTDTLGFTLLAVGFSSLVLASALGNGTRALLQILFTNRHMRSIGKYSYGIYVYHVPLLGACELVILRHIPPAIAQNAWFAVGYVLFLGGLSYVVAKISYETFERPILSLKRYFEPAARTAPAHALEG